MRRFHRIILYLLILSASSCQTKEAAVQSQWQQLSSGIWKIQYGAREEMTLTSHLDISPRWEAIEEMGEAEFPIDESQVRFETVDHKTYIRFPLERGEQIYGLGLNFQTVEQRGRILRLHVDHYGGADNGRTHAPVPFFVSSKGYGALINAARYIDVYAGTGVRKDSQDPPEVMDRNTDKDWSAQPYSDNLEFLVPSDGVEVILFSGKTMLEVVRRFNLYNGGGTLPPKWGLGFWHRTPTLYSDGDVMKEVEEMQEHGVPLTVIGLEPGWQSASYPCTYEWDKGRFPNPAGFIKDLQEKDIQVNLWMNPGVSPKSGVYEKIEPFTASHTEWCGILPDYSMKEAQEIMADHWKKNLLDVGISGYKMDENDGYDNWVFPDVATFPSRHSAEQMRQTYGSLMQDLQTRLFKEQNQRTYGLVRASNAGTSSFPFVLYNDYYNHKDFITALINSSFIGVLWTPEVRSSKNGEEWLRRMQTACFSPLAMLNAWSDGTKPWSFPEVERQVNDYLRLRMRLIPYLYTAFADYCFKGIPPFRAMNLEEGYNYESQIEAGKLDATENPYAMALKKEAKDQYMVGEHLLVAPVFEGEKERQVVLPEGKWYDFYTGKLAGQSQVITVKADLDHIPVFVKDGGIIPLMPAVERLDGSKQPLEIRHYGQKPSSYLLYDDDGKTYDYLKGAYTNISIQVERDAQGQLKGSVSIPEGKQIWSYDGNYTFRFMTPDEKD